MNLAMVMRRAVLLGVTSFLACQRPAEERTTASSTTAARVALPDDATVTRLAPLATDWIEKIPLADGGFAYVTPPRGATEPRPIVVAAHGAVDDPGLMCSAWRLVTDVFPFVVCPAGRPLGPAATATAYVWSSTDELERRVMLAIAAVEAKWPGYVTPGAPVIFTGFSQGATAAGPLLTHRAARIPRAVLTEGGHHVFEGNQAAAFVRAGGSRVLFSCSQAGCAPSFAASKASLERANVGVVVLDAGPHGHSLPPPVRQKLNAKLPWVVEGLAGWEGYAGATKLTSH